jgi:hypothetical protein
MSRLRLAYLRAAWACGGRPHLQELFDGFLHSCQWTPTFTSEATPVLRGLAQRSGPGARADRHESERAPRGRGPPGADGTTKRVTP